MSRTELCFWLLGFALLLTAMFLLTGQARAHPGMDWSLSSAASSDLHKASHYQGKRKVARKKKPLRYYAAPTHEKEEWRCLDHVRVVGSQWVGAEGAEDSAKKAFMEEVRWRFGEAFMDVANARDYEKRCSRSSVGEAVGQTLIRCEIAARPCRPPMSAGK